MKSLFHYIRQKLSVKVSLWILLFAVVIFGFALGLLFMKAQKNERQEGITLASRILDKNVLRVTSIMDRVEVASKMTGWLVQRNYEYADSMFVYSKSMLLNNPDFYNCSVAFEPDYYQKYGRYCSAYSKWVNDTIRVIQGGSDDYQYFYMDWYLLPKLLDCPCWTEPYVDIDIATNTKGMVTSFSRPLKDRTGKIIGVLNTSLSLNWLSKTISSELPFPNSYSILIGKGGTFFVNPDSTKLLCQTIFTGTIQHPDAARTALGQAMIHGEEGMRQLNIDGNDCYVFYKPVGNTGWSMAIVCPERDIFSKLISLRQHVIAIVAVGVLLMLFLFIRIITRELKPLRSLAKETEAIASGQFDTELPNMNRIDEIGQLSTSFGNMQRSLVSYIDELKQTTAQKASIESELKVASDIQMSMVPRVFPPFPERKDIDLHASMTPAKEVGGDLYNFLLLDERLYICLGDVSGKGVPASLFMAQSTRLFRTLAGEGFSPEAIANRMNNALCEGNDTMMFVTIFIGMVDLQTGRLDYCNCGHNPPVLDGQFVELKYKNCPLGMFEGAPFQGECIPDIRGKQFLVYTDGLNEAMNPEKEQFGNDRLLALMATSTDMTSCQVIEMLKEAVEQHRNGAAPNDDLTLLCLSLATPKS